MENDSAEWIAAHKKTEQRYTQYIYINNWIVSDFMSSQPLYTIVKLAWIWIETK